VSGLNGDWGQVGRVRAALGLLTAPTRKDAHDGLFALDLAELRLPAALARGELRTRAPVPSEREQLVAWRTAYDIELLGGDDTAETRTRAAAFLDWQWADDNLCVAVLGEQIVSLSAFNATLPEIVQLGGIYTPPDLRNRGYARVAVAGSLQVAITRGAARAVLFSDNPAAIRSYESVGFRRIGEYALVLLR
jgi:RimJ/RimL family protein N-acetyltransferase